MLLSSPDSDGVHPMVLLLGAEAGGWRHRVVREINQWGLLGSAVSLDRYRTPLDQAKEWATVQGSADLVIYWLDKGLAEDELQLGIAMAQRKPVIVGIHRELGQDQQVADVLYLFAHSVGCQLQVCVGLEDTIIAARNFLRGVTQR